MSDEMLHSSSPDTTGKKNYLSDAITLKNNKDVTAIYKAWAKEYDSEMANHTYIGPSIVTDTVVNLDVPLNGRIIDVGAGTGIVSRLLQLKGYDNVDALDGTQEMLDIAKENKLYKNYYCAMLGEGLTIKEIASDTYDVATMTGVFSPKHMDASVFPELLRIIKTGGVLVFIRALNYAQEYPELGEAFDEEVERLVSLGRWKHHTPTVEVEGYAFGNSGKLYIMKKVS